MCNTKAVQFREDQPARGKIVTYSAAGVNFHDHETDCPFMIILCNMGNEFWSHTVILDQRKYGGFMVWPVD